LCLMLLPSRPGLPSDFCRYQIHFEFNIVEKAHEFAFFLFLKPANQAEKVRNKQPSHLEYCLEILSIAKLLLFYKLTIMRKLKRMLVACLLVLSASFVFAQQQVTISGVSTSAADNTPLQDISVTVGENPTINVRLAVTTLIERFLRECKNRYPSHRTFTGCSPVETI
jgi:hypothetical protein